MTIPSRSSLLRFFQQLGLEAVMPGLNQETDVELQRTFATVLSFFEAHEDLGISENFKPTMLPSVLFTDVKNATEDIRSPRYHEDKRSPLMNPYFCTLTKQEVISLSSYDPQRISLIEPPLDSDIFMGCRVFFRVVAEALEQGFRIVVLNNVDHSLGLAVHIKALRTLKPLPELVQQESGSTLLFQVEYYLMNADQTQTHSPQEDLQIFKDFVQQQPKGKTRIILGTVSLIHFVHQILQAHESILDKSIFSEHDKEWKARQKYVRPSFVVPLGYLSSGSKRSSHLQEIFARAEPSARAESESKEPCAVCGKTNVELKVCSACKLVKYCTRDCQASDWQSHKPTCRAMVSYHK